MKMAGFSLRFDVRNNFILFEIHEEETWLLKPGIEFHGFQTVDPTSTIFISFTFLRQESLYAGHLQGCGIGISPEVNGV